MISKTTTKRNFVFQTDIFFYPQRQIFIFLCIKTTGTKLDFPILKFIF
jgi:hypothetical protein